MFLLRTFKIAKQVDNVHYQGKADQLRSFLLCSFLSMLLNLLFPLNFRYRTAEIAFTLQGLTSLISALKKIPPAKGIVYGLYLFRIHNSEPNECQIPKSYLTFSHVFSFISF